ncbi:adenylate kinase-like [Hibiscus syriacus]|uniref:adenylate kinase-like n=1 Tax=Hibiscus syriacus TaxID=106335 RepID=UPI001920A32C|nr:adenylate kinase-like [Hibiscus syriacus]
MRCLYSSSRQLPPNPIHSWPPPSEATRPRAKIPAKGTCSECFSNLLCVPHIATGDLFPEELAYSGPLCKQLTESVNQGKLVSDEIITSLSSKRLEAGETKGNIGRRNRH